MNTHFTGNPLIKACLGLLLMGGLFGCGSGDSGVANRPEFGERAPNITQCMRANTPLLPPEQGAILWSPPDANPAHPNAIVLAYSTVEENKLELQPNSACTQVLKRLQTITIAKGSALLAVCSAWNGERELVLPWGAVNVTASDPKPYDFTKCWEKLSARVDNSFSLKLLLTSPSNALEYAPACRQCDLSGKEIYLFNVGFKPQYRHDPDGIYVNKDFSGANLQGTRINGDASFTNFSNANLSQAVFVFSALSSPTHIGASNFDHATLQGTDFRNALFDVYSRDEDNVPCMSFKNTNLVTALFDVKEWSWSEACQREPVFDGSQISMDLMRQLITRIPINQVTLSGAQIVSSPQDWRSLAGADLAGINLSGASFLGVPTDFTGTRFDDANLIGTNFGRSIFRGSTFKNANAAGASFFEADLSGDGASAHPGANFSGSQTNLKNANFVNANISYASFIGADLSGAVFSGARAVGTDFSGVRAAKADFTGAHIYGNGQAFDSATDLEGVKFAGAVLAGDAATGGGFNFTRAPLTGASFDGTVCVGCNFTEATMNQASFTRAYLPGVTLTGATLAGANFDRAWFYCGDESNSGCTPLPGTPSPGWAWPLLLGSGEAYGPVPFHAINLTGVSLSNVTACPDGQPGNAPPGNCQGHLLPLPDPSGTPPFPMPCSASAEGACPIKTVTLFASPSAQPLAIVPTTSPIWNMLHPAQNYQNGYYVGFDDGTVHLVKDTPNLSSPSVAGVAGQYCSDPEAPCGDGGPAKNALLGKPNGLAVGLDGSIYIADPVLHRVRRIDPFGIISTVAGTGEACSSTAAGNCGDGGLATTGTFAGPYGLAVDPAGTLFIADGPRGVRRVSSTGMLSTIAPGTSTHDVQALALLATPSGAMIYATTANPDAIVQINAVGGAVTTVVGTGTSGYNGNMDPNTGLLLPGTQVQVKQPLGIAINREGNVIFADSGNHLIRAYVPSTTYVIDDLAGKVGSNGIPEGGFNGDGESANKTQLNAPRSVTSTENAELVIADTGNHRIRLVGPVPIP